MTVRVPSLLLELWVLRQLNTPDLFAGDTTPRIRAERVRAELVKRGLGNQVARRVRNRRPETWAQLFEGLYGEPLSPDRPTQLALGETNR